MECGIVLSHPGHASPLHVPMKHTLPVRCKSSLAVQAPGHSTVALAFKEPWTAASHCVPTPLPFSSLHPTTGKRNRVQVGILRAIT